LCSYRGKRLRNYSDLFTTMRKSYKFIQKKLIFGSYDVWNYRQNWYRSITIRPHKVNYMFLVPCLVNLFAQWLHNHKIEIFKMLLRFPACILCKYSKLVSRHRQLLSISSTVASVFVLFFHALMWSWVH